MLKTISAALLAASVIAAPAFAAGKSVTQAPVIKADHAQSHALHPAGLSAKVLNANARMDHHHHHRHHRHVHAHRHHHTMASVKAPMVRIQAAKVQPKVIAKQVAPIPAGKRG